MAQHLHYKTVSIFQWRPKYVRQYEIFMKMHSFVVNKSWARAEEGIKNYNHLYLLFSYLYTFANFLTGSQRFNGTFYFLSHQQLPNSLSRQHRQGRARQV